MYHVERLMALQMLNLTFLIGQRKDDQAKGNLGKGEYVKSRENVIIEWSGKGEWGKAEQGK